jgi:hypothetical protein
MRDVFHGDGDEWLITEDGYDRRRAVSTFVFHCVSNSQRPYRVIEVAEPLLQGRGVDRLSDTELTDMFERSHTMDYSHDAAASPLSHGYGDPPLE